MSANIIDGKKISEEILSEVKKEASKMAKKPCLAIIFVGENPASSLYVKKKVEACEKVGILSKVIRFPAGISSSEVIHTISKLNKDPLVDGILVQLPLPENLNENEILDNIVPIKDVDGLHTMNIGKLSLGISSIVACTPQGVLHMLKKSGVALRGKHAVVIGRSRIVGKPLSMLLLNEDCTVTICHSRTEKLSEIVRNCDIVCIAVGKPGMLTSDMIKPGAIVIDIGTSKVNGKLAGDVDFESVKVKASQISPVPGGVGPMTVAMLMKNTLKCAQNRENQDRPS